MSQDNVEQVRRGTEHWLRTGEPLWDDVDPDFEIHDFDIPDGGIYRGLEGFHEWIADVSRPFDDFAWEPLEYVDAGDGQVVLLGRTSGRGKESGVPIARLDGMVWTHRDSKAVRLDYYGTHEEALEAAGVSR